MYDNIRAYNDDDDDDEHFSSVLKIVVIKQLFRSTDKGSFASGSRAHVELGVYGIRAQGQAFRTLACT